MFYFKYSTQNRRKTWKEVVYTLSSLFLNKINPLSLPPLRSCSIEKYSMSASSIQTSVDDHPTASWKRDSMPRFVSMESNVLTVLTHDCIRPSALVSERTADAVLLGQGWPRWLNPVQTNLAHLMISLRINAASTEVSERVGTPDHHLVFALILRSNSPILCTMSLSHW